MTPEKQPPLILKLYRHTTTAVKALLEESYTLYH